MEKTLVVANSHLQLGMFWVVPSVPTNPPANIDKMRHFVTLSALFITGTYQNIPQMNIERPSLNLTEIQDTFREKCTKNGANEDTLTAFTNQLNSCLESHLNFTQFQEELEEAKKTGSMDVVFGKYCLRYPRIYDCLENATSAARPCLNFIEEEFLDESLQFLGTLKEYMCFKDGNRIALFVSQGGVECFQAKREQVEQCVKEIFGDGLEDFSIGTLLKFNSTVKCNALMRTRSCFYEELTKCKQGIPANVIDAFFRFLTKHLSCETLLLARESKYDDLWIRVSGVTLFLLIVALIFYKLFKY